MRMAGLFRTGAVFLVAGAFVHSPSLAADITTAEAKQFVVDVVWLKGGSELRGAIVDHQKTGPVIAVRREWLRESDPTFFAAEEIREADAVRQADEQLLQRLEEWLKLRPDGERLTATLKLEQKECQSRLKNKETTDSEFMLIPVAQDDVRRTYAQPRERRQLAEVAWQLKLEDVESSRARELQSLLDKEYKDWKQSEPDLSERLPPIEQSEDEWTARVALWEYILLQPCDFQGTNDFVVRTDNGAERPDVASLLAPAFGGGLQSQLDELLNPDLSPQQKPRDKWRQQATDAAEKGGLNACRVTRVNLDAAQLTGSVACDFLVRLPNGRWETIWKSETAADSTKVTDEMLERLRNDPQVQSVEKIFAGLGGGGELDRAIRFGAAVQAAQQTADSQFASFRDRLARRLSGPPLRWESSNAAAKQP